MPKAIDLPYPNVEVVWRHVIEMLMRLVALWKHFCCYNGLDPFLWLLAYCTVMYCNTTAFEGYAHSDVLASMNTVG